VSSAWWEGASTSSRPIACDWGTGPIRVASRGSAGGARRPSRTIEGAASAVFVAKTGKEKATRAMAATI